MRMMKTTWVLIAMVAVTLFAVTPAMAVPVDLELSLLVDVSGSVDSSEFNLQTTGYVDAFKDTDVINAILGGSNKAIAVNYIHWSSTSNQALMVGWTLINSEATSKAFADAITAAGRGFAGGLTAPGSAINYGVPLFTGNGYEGARLVMDVSGDGEQNTGASTSAARDAAALAGITINGLSIGDTDLFDWYVANIKTTDGFVVAASGFDTFGNAIKEKLKSEIGPEEPEIPEPASMMLLGTGLMGLFGFRRKRS